MKNILLFQGAQHFSTDPSLYPLNEPMPKVESEAQCTGETRYADDVPPAEGELHGAFVVSTLAACELDKVDPSEALVSSTFF